MDEPLLQEVDLRVPGEALDMLEHFNFWLGHVRTSIFWLS